MPALPIAEIISRKNAEKLHEFPMQDGYIFAGRGAAHIWEGTDTACKMASTGGLLLRKYTFLSRAPDAPICANCTRLIVRREPKLVWPELPIPATEGEKAGA